MGHRQQNKCDANALWPCQMWALENKEQALHKCLNDCNVNNPAVCSSINPWWVEWQRVIQVSFQCEVMHLITNTHSLYIPLLTENLQCAWYFAKYFGLLYKLVFGAMSFELIFIATLRQNNTFLGECTFKYNIISVTCLGSKQSC